MLTYLRARLDWIGGLLALLYGLPSLGYVFGRDQSLFCYMGREWAAGRLPYVEAFDIKPPGIYAVYALAGKLFGFQMWSIRILELGAVLALGVCIALAVRRDGPRLRGELGAAMLLTSAAYFTVFDYWDTGQVEFWEGFTALLGYLAAERMRSPIWAALVSGLLGGVAIMFKMPVAVVLPIAGCVVTARAYIETKRVRSAALTLAAHCAGAALVVFAVLGYFKLRGGWPALVELAEYTKNYVKNTSPEADARNSIRWFWAEIGGTWAKLLLVLFACGVALAARRDALRVLGGQALAVLLTLAAMVTVAAQLKYWAYHWVVVAPFALLCAAYGLYEIARIRSQAVLPIVMVATLLGYSYSLHWGSNPGDNYRSYTQSFWSYVRGSSRRSEFLAQFRGPHGYDYAQQEEVGERIRELAKPGDMLHVQGFEPAIYIHAHLASPSRFASDAPLALTSNPAWLAEHDAVLAKKLPRFYVTYVMNGADIETLTQRGYKPLGQLGRFYWLEHPPVPKKARKSRKAKPKG